MALSRRAFLLGSGAALVLGTGGYTTCVEPFWPRVRRVTMTLPNLPPFWKGRTVCQLSDLHVCHRIPLSYLREVFQHVSRLRPDVVVYTGDFVTIMDNTFPLLRELRPHFAHGALGTYGILGNHDYDFGWHHSASADEVAAIARSADIHVLRNESTTLSGLQIVGLDDVWANRFQPRTAFAKSDHDAPTIALAHNPDAADLFGWGEFRGWILSGHTHGGQVQPPFLPPPLLPVKNRRYTAGEFDVGHGRTLYINRGLGYLYRVRFNVRPEITLFTLA